MRSVWQNNVKLLKYRKIAILSKYYKSYRMRISQVIYTYKSTSFTIFLTYLKNTFSFLVQHVFHWNISRWKRLLLLLRRNLKRATETKMFDFILL